MNCPACDRVARARSSDDPFLLADLQEAVAVLHKHQPYHGWCTLWLKDHHEHFGLLPADRQRRLMEDVAQISRAMHAALPGLRRINYECLGNVVPHVHWHLIPRYDRPVDPDPGSTVWTRPQSELDCGVSDPLRDDLVARLRAALAAR